MRSRALTPTGRHHRSSARRGTPAARARSRGARDRAIRRARRGSTPEAIEVGREARSAALPAEARAPGGRVRGSLEGDAREQGAPAPAARGGQARAPGGRARAARVAGALVQDAPARGARASEHALRASRSFQDGGRIPLDSYAATWSSPFISANRAPVRAVSTARASSVGILSRTLFLARIEPRIP